jgi:acetyl esterase/lipase
MFRLFAAVILLLLSILVLFRAPANFLWLLDVVTTSFPYVFMLLAAALFLTIFNYGRFRIFIAVSSVVAFLLFSLPIVIVYWRERNLSKELAAEFPSANTHHELRRPFSFIKMFTGIGIAKVPYQTITYKTLADENLTFDYYPSDSVKKSPVVIVIHGGAWESGDSKQLPALNSYLADRGYNVAAINYRLAPAYKSPAPVEDTKDVIAFLFQNADRLNIDTNNIILLGRSAGAQIALVTAYSLHNKNIKGVVSFYGPADMVWGGQTKVSKLVLNTDKIYTDFFGGLYSEVPDKFKESSACEYVDASSTPTLMIHGTTDPLVSYYHSVHLQEKLNAADVKNYFLDLPLATHGCDFNLNSPYGQISTYTVERFINSVTSN